MYKELPCRSNAQPAAKPGGAFVISLDFELHWGVRDHRTIDSSYRANLLGARQVIPRLLDLFEEFEIAATWATVGFLFARNSKELRDSFPSLRPKYHEKNLDPYGQWVGLNEEDDPLHYAPSLISSIQRRPRQEIGSHTHSHYYCLEAGQTADAFRADMASAVQLAKRHGVELRSLVFPRNQVNAEYLCIVSELGFDCYRGADKGWMHRPSSRRSQSQLLRMARLVDHYLPISGSKSVGWRESCLDWPENIADGPVNVGGSMFLRPYSPAMRHGDGIRLKRLCSAVRQAAATENIFHLWWHPHNFGSHQSENLLFLRQVLRAVSECRQKYNFDSLTMGQVADRVKRAEYYERPLGSIPVAYPSAPKSAACR